MAQENHCYIHKDTTTRLSCNSCGKPICPKCMVTASVGYKCPDCTQQNKSQIEEITQGQYITAIISGLMSGVAAGFIWNFLKAYGPFINILVAYAVGFCIAKTIVKLIGSKIGTRIQVIAGSIALISLVYNPILVIMALFSGAPLLGVLFAFTMYNMTMYNIVAVVIGIWAAVRHFKF